MDSTADASNSITDAITPTLFLQQIYTVIIGANLLKTNQEKLDKRNGSAKYFPFEKANLCDSDTLTI